MLAKMDVGQHGRLTSQSSHSNKGSVSSSLQLLCVSVHHPQLLQLFTRRRCQKDKLLMTIEGAAYYQMDQAF